MQIRVDETELLFPSNLIPSSFPDRLGSDLYLRPLAVTDYSRGHFELLSVLTAAPIMSQHEYIERFQVMKSCLRTYFTIVIIEEASNMLVACGTIFLERKFTRSGGTVGHIEDIAVSDTMRGRKLGFTIIKTLEGIARSQGCYKVILDCSKANVPFYEKCGFKQKELQMVLYMDDDVPPVGMVTPRL